jgi:Fic family protein
LLRSVTEKENWNDWIMFMLTALIETTQLTTKKIKAMLSLKSDCETQMKIILGSSFSYELLQLMFTLPYLKIDLIVNKNIAHRQTASAWLKKLTDADILRPQKMGRTTYYINYRLMEILSSNYL